MFKIIRTNFSLYLEETVRYDGKYDNILLFEPNPIHAPLKLGKPNEV